MLPAMLIAQITDLHVTARGLRVFGTVDTNAHLAAAVAHLNALDPRPDLVIATGDLVNGPKPGEYEMLAELLAPLAIPLRVIPGNHDDRDSLRALFPTLPREGEFLHHTVDDGAVRVILLDTQVAGAVHGELCAERLGWLAARLDEAPERPTLIAMHHQPFTTGMAGLDRIGCRGADAFADLVAGRGNVLGVVCGHVHRPIATRWAGTVAFAAPSTAHQFALTLHPEAPFRWTPEPPALALHHWHPDGTLATHLSYVGAGYEPREYR